MTEHQLSLKLILDQYAACALSLEDAESQIVESRQCEPQPIFFESPKPMHMIEQEAFRKQFGDLFCQRYKAVLLVNGVKLSDGQAFRPEQLNIECGSLSINVNRSCLGTITVDGVPLKVRSADIHLSVGEQPSVKLEIVV